MLEVGETFSGVVKDLASNGQGVVTHPCGRTFFVAGIWLGERGEFCITALKGRIGFASLVSLEESSKHAGRTSAPCAHHGFTQHHCGGCPWQFMAYAEQLAAKQARVEQAMARLACAEQVQPIIGSTSILAYRNRAQLKTDGQKLGYMAANSNHIVAVNQCPILSEHNQQTLADLKQQLPNHQWKPKSQPRARSKAKWVTLDIDESTNADTVSINARLPFQQANSDQNQHMRQWLADGLAETARDKSVLELFCGSGNLTEMIVAAGASKVFAVEAVAAALQQLKQRNWPVVETLECDLFSEQEAEKLHAIVKKAEILVLDPPRDGLKISTPLFTKKSTLKTVFYISCDLATFSRDLGEFLKQGFTVYEIQPLDMFPHTPHIELMAKLVRKK